MAEGRVRWGVLSAAKIAREWVVPGIHMSDRGELAAVASLTPGKAAALAAPYGGVTLHDSYEALLADPGVDAIYIPLPNHQHVEWTAKCLEAGKHVLCEKPIALRAEEIDPLIALRDRTGLVAAEAFMVTHHPQWIRARELVRQGAIGTAPPGAGRLHLLQRRSGQHPQPGRHGRRRAARHRGLSLRSPPASSPARSRSRCPGPRSSGTRGIDATARVVAEFPELRHGLLRLDAHGAAAAHDLPRRQGLARACMRPTTPAPTATR